MGENLCIGMLIIFLGPLSFKIKIWIEKKAGSNDLEFSYEDISLQSPLMKIFHKSFQEACKERIKELTNKTNFVNGVACDFNNTKIPSENEAGFIFKVIISDEVKDVFPPNLKQAMDDETANLRESIAENIAKAIRKEKGITVTVIIHGWIPGSIIIKGKVLSLHRSFDVLNIIKDQIQNLFSSRKIEVEEIYQTNIDKSQLVLSLDMRSESDILSKLNDSTLLDLFMEKVNSDIKKG